jgi:cytochrome c553
MKWRRNVRKIILLPMLACFSIQVHALPADCTLTKADGTKRVMTPNGEILASQCYQCHGYEGHSLGEIDSIAGKSASDLYGDLKEFKSNGKKDIMSLQARQYTDCEMDAIANYLSTLPNQGD